MAIDAVVTWVDGADPAHRRRLQDFLATRADAAPAAAHPTRFNDAGELEYCIASILRFAPWFRTLHIVTDAQTPALVRQLAATPWEGRVRIVDHREIFAGFERHLPTFNSRAIITALWRIPGLSDDFVYFNDDMVLLRPVEPGDFFRDGKVVLRGAWRRQSASAWWKRAAAALKAGRGNTRVGNLDAQQASARIAGFERDYYRLYHNPYPMRRATLQAFFARHPQLLESNLSHRLRSTAQFKTEAVATHLEIAQGSALLDNRLHTVQLKPSQQWPPRMRHKMRRADRDPLAAFACVQSIEMAPMPLQAEVMAWLQRRIGSLDDVLLLPK